ncbi:MAG: hypothetical protein QM775_33375 [Pirellulales bacterium]
MSVPMSAPDLLTRDFLEVRAKILELAACLDRFQRAEGTLAGDPRMQRIEQGLAALQGAARLEDGEPTRAEQVQQIFSLPYDDGLRTKWGI